MKKDVTWLSVIGINENGILGLSEQARSLIAGASLVVGGRRHLELVGLCHPAFVAESGDKTNDRDCDSRPRNECGVTTLVWENPIKKTIAEILSYRPKEGLDTSRSLSRATTRDWYDKGGRVCVLASGDPFCYGIGVSLARYVPISEMLVIPAPSCFSLAAAKLGWAFTEVATIGLNGRAIEKIIPLLQPKAKILALSTDENTPAILEKLLSKRRFADAKITVLEHLGGEKERIREFGVRELKEIPACAGMTIGRLNMMAIEIPAGLVSQALPLASGLDDDLYEHDGQITKREIRAITLSSLAPRRGELLWDIGLGAGSVAIEWLLCSSANRAIGFEKNNERAARAMRNAGSLGVPDLQIIQGDVPEILEGVETPDAIFIGGGGGNPQTIEIAWEALKFGGRLVVNSVTFETEAVVIAAHKKYGGRIIRIGIERAEAVGSMTALRPAMSVLQWSVTK